LKYTLAQCPGSCRDRTAYTVHYATLHNTLHRVGHERKRDVCHIHRCCHNHFSTNSV